MHGVTMRLVPRLLRVAKRVLPARNLHLCTRAPTSRIKLVGSAAVLTGLLVQHSAGEGESSQLSVDMTCEEVTISAWSATNRHQCADWLCP